MKISPEGEKYADTLFFNRSREIHEERKKALLQHKFVSNEDTAQADYALHLQAAAKMAVERMQSYIAAYEHEGEQIDQEDAIEFIKAAKDIIHRQSDLILSGSEGTITMVRNQWTPVYREQMLTLFREKAFRKIEPEMNRLILKADESKLKKASRRKTSRRTELFRWIFEQCHGKQFVMTDLRGYLATHAEWTETELSSSSDYLEGENLVEQKDDSGMLVWLTHDGVRAGASASDVENINKERPLILQAQNINSFHGPVGSFQQGDKNVANVTQNANANLSDVLPLIRELRNHFKPDASDAGNEYIDLLEEELEKDSPKESRVRLFLKGVGSLVTEAGKAVVGEVTKKLLSGEIQPGG